MKKIVALLLCLAMIFSLSAVAFAEEASTADKVRDAVRQNIITSTKVITTFAKEAADKVADYAKDNEEAMGKVVGDTVADAIVYGTAKSAELVEFGANTANTVVQNTLAATENLPTEAVAAGAAVAAAAPVVAAALVPATLAAKGLIAANVAALAAVAAPLAIPAAGAAVAAGTAVAAKTAAAVAPVAAALAPAALAAKGLIAAQVATVAALIPADLAAKTAAALAVAIPADLAVKAAGAKVAAQVTKLAAIAQPFAATALAYYLNVSPAGEALHKMMGKTAAVLDSMVRNYVYPAERLLGSAVVKAQDMLADSIHMLDIVPSLLFKAAPITAKLPTTVATMYAQHMLATSLDKIDSVIINVVDTTQPGLIVKTVPHVTKAPKTFDAGIALYVGLAVMGVTGSAVVIGKKKEF